MTGMGSDDIADHTPEQVNGGAPRIDPEHNREILAERSCWPPGALDNCRDLERRHPGWHAWWTDHPWRRDGNVPDRPAYGAAHVAGVADSLYAASPDELAGLIRAAEEEHRRTRPWLFHGPQN